MTIDDMVSSFDNAKTAATLISECEDAAAKFALAHTVKMLGDILRSGDLHACRRTPARSAYRMGCAALGIEEAA